MGLDRTKFDRHLIRLSVVHTLRDPRAFERYSSARVLLELERPTKIFKFIGGNLSAALLLVSVISALCACFTNLHKDRIKDGHNPRVLRAVRISAIASIVVAMLAGVNQYYARQQAGELRVAQMRLTVLSSLSNYRVDMLDDYLWLVVHSVTTKNYLSYEAARTSSGDAATAIPDWNTAFPEALRSEIAKSKSAFDHLQKISRDVLMEAATYPAMVPAPITEWATATLALKFSDLPRVMDPYHATPESVQYAHLIGQAVGSITGGMTRWAGVMTQ